MFGTERIIMSHPFILCKRMVYCSFIENDNNNIIIYKYIGAVYAHISMMMMIPIRNFFFRTLDNCLLKTL